MGEIKDAKKRKSLENNIVVFLFAQNIRSFDILLLLRLLG
jgi:hypothetical protein